MSNSSKPAVDMVASVTGGLRDNKGKARLSKVPSELEEAVAEVIFRSSTEGGGKYPMDNWRKGLPWSQVAESAMRHLKAFAQKGEDYDEESGLDHLAHAACNIAFLLWYRKYRPALDDRKEFRVSTTPAPTTSSAVDVTSDVGRQGLTEQEVRDISGLVTKYGTRC